MLDATAGQTDKQTDGHQTDALYRCGCSQRNNGQNRLENSFTIFVFGFGDRCKIIFKTLQKYVLGSRLSANKQCLHPIRQTNPRSTQSALQCGQHVMARSWQHAQNFGKVLLCGF